MKHDLQPHNGREQDLLPVSHLQHGFLAHFNSQAAQNISKKRDIAPIMELEVQKWVYEVHAASSREIITEVQVQDRDIAIRGQP